MNTKLSSGFVVVWFKRGVSVLWSSGVHEGPENPGWTQIPWVDISESFVYLYYIGILLCSGRPRVCVCVCGHKMVAYLFTTV